MAVNPKILIVEDDQAVLEVEKLMLSDKYDLVTATDGNEAVRKYVERRPSLVLMDIMLPVMDGVQATKEILKIDPNARIIGVTAYAVNRGKELLRAGALDILKKPFSRNELVEIIDKFLSD